MSIYTDLVLESSELKADCICGVSKAETALKHKIKRCDITVMTDEAAAVLGRTKGCYITIEAKQLLSRNSSINSYLSKQIAKALTSLIAPLRLKKGYLTLVVGIGNRSMTADALGPRVIDKIIVTRHFLSGSFHEEMRLSPVCAISPGVLGETGIESFEVISSLTKSVNPDLIIVVDSLASRRTERISTTFQMSDTGLTPGGGLGGSRPPINKGSLGVPVIAVGVPFVVYARTMGLDVAEELIKQGSCSESNLTASLNRTISDLFGDLVVTPKDIDCLIDDAANVISLGINLALHHNLTAKDIMEFSY